MEPEPLITLAMPKASLRLMVKLPLLVMAPVLVPNVPVVPLAPICNVPVLMVVVPV